MSDFEMKVGDTLPYLDATLNDANGPVDLTGAIIRVVMESSGGVEIINQTSTGSLVSILSSTGGQVRYAWQPNDLARAGNYALEWEAIFGTGAQIRFPNSRHVSLTVKPALST